MATQIPQSSTDTLYMIAKPLTEFHLIPKLPMEIQVKIYETAIDDVKARNIHIQPKSTGNFVPAIIHTSVFVRDLALRKYTRFVVSARKYGRKFAFLVNLKKDSVVLADSKVPPILPGSMYGLTEFADLTYNFTKLYTQVQDLTIHQKALQMPSTEMYDAIWTDLFLGPPKITLCSIMEICPQLKNLTIVLDAKHGHENAPPFSPNSIDPFRYMARFKQEISRIRTEEKLLRIEESSKLDNTSGEPKESDEKEEEEMHVRLHDDTPESWRLRLNFMVKNDPHKQLVTYCLPLHLYL